MRRQAVWSVVVLGLVACKQQQQGEEESDRCLNLPAAVRSNLTAGPDGDSLYWLESTRNYDFDGDRDSWTRLIKYDVRAQRAEVVLENAAAPVQFLRRQLLARRAADNYRIALLARDYVQELTPGHLDVLDIELVDMQTIAFLADGEGARAVYGLDMRELRPYHLVDANALLSGSSGRVYALRGDEIIVVDVKTRSTQQRPMIKRSIPLGDHLVFVENGKVMFHNIVSGTSQAKVTTARDWRVHHQNGSILARTKPTNDRSHSFLLTEDRVMELPTIVGGASIISATRLKNQTWALIGHNTQNYEGDLALTNAEVDICRLPASGDVTFPTRQVPARFASYSERLFAALRETAPSATLQIYDVQGEPVTVSIHLLKEFGARDLEGIRKRTRDLHERVTSILHDPEVRTEVIFADRRVGQHRWKRDRNRFRTGAGMGDSLMSDAADFDFEVDKLDNEKKDTKITCAGTLRNVSAKPISNFDIRCSGNRSHVIRIDRLEPGQTRDFSQTFDVSEDGEVAFLEVLVDGKPSRPRNAGWEASAMEVFALATDVYAATQLWLDDHHVSDDEIIVTLRTEAEFLRKDSAAQAAAIEKAYKHYERLRSIWGVGAKTPLRVHVDVQLDDTTFDFDGTKLEVN